MRILRLLAIAAFLSLGAQGAALAQDSPRARLVGLWDEFQPGSNLVEFAGDGTWKLYLKKGEIGDLRTLNGEWTVNDEGVLTTVLVMQGQRKAMTSKLSFAEEEMILTDPRGGITRHRRNSGPIPAWFQW